MRWAQPCTDNAIMFYLIGSGYLNRECGTSGSSTRSSIPASTREFTLTSLDPNTEYQVRVIVFTNTLSESLISTINTKVAGSKCLLHID